MSASFPGARHSRLSIPIRAALSIALLAFLGWKIPLRDTAHALAAFPVSGLLLALVVMAAQVVTGAARWRRTLVRTRARVPLATLVGDVLVGSAYNLVLPSAVGGDVIRALRCARRPGVGHHAWSTMIFERIVGLVSLALVAAPGIAIVPGGHSLIVPVVLVAALAALALILADAPLRFLERRALARAPSLAALSSGVADDLAGPLATTGARLEALAWSIAYQLLGISILTACVLPLGDHALIAAIYAGVPLIVVGAMLPITVGGLGLREALFVTILSRLSVPQHTALALALLWLSSYLVLALAGLLTQSLSPTLPAQSPPDPSPPDPSPPAPSPPAPSPP